MHPLFVCPKVFSVRRAVSIPTWSQDDTVMAVAADSHRDFLTPERLNVRQRAILPDELRIIRLYKLLYIFFSVLSSKKTDERENKAQHAHRYEGIPRKQGSAKRFRFFYTDRREIERDEQDYRVDYK